MVSHEDKLMELLNKNLSKIYNKNEDEFKKFDKEEVVLNFDKIADINASQNEKILIDKDNQNE